MVVVLTATAGCVRVRGCVKVIGSVKVAGGGVTYRDSRVC